MLKILKYLAYAVVLSGLVVGCQNLRNSGDQTLSAPAPQALRMATLNVHYIIMEQATGAWSRGDWDRRKGPLDLMFKEINADVIGFQEMESFARSDANPVNLTLDWLLDNNPDFAAAAVGDPAEFPSTQPILYRRDRAELLDQGWFFFSDTPDVIYSRTFNGSYPAFASWALLRDRASGALFRVVNIHTDFGSRSNRLQSVALVAERIAPWVAADENLFVIGDMNGRHGSQTLETIETAGITFVPVEGATYHFNIGLNLFGAIDHIGYRGRITPIGAPIVLRRKYQGEWPTDHYPVIADFTLQP